VCECKSVNCLVSLNTGQNESDYVKNSSKNCVKHDSNIQVATNVHVISCSRHITEFRGSSLNLINHRYSSLSHHNTGYTPDGLVLTVTMSLASINLLSTVAINWNWYSVPEDRLVVM